MNASPPAALTAGPGYQFAGFSGTLKTQTWAGKLTEPRWGPVAACWTVRRCPQLPGFPVSLASGTFMNRSSDDTLTEPPTAEGAEFT